MVGERPAGDRTDTCNKLATAVLRLFGPRAVLSWVGLVLLPAAAIAQGTWTTNTQPWPIHAIHMVLLPDKRLLLLNRSRPVAAERDFNVATIGYPYDGPGQIIDAPMIDGVKRELFCAGHTLDEDGNAVFAGGHYGPTSTFDRHGIADVWMFRWETDQWRRLSDMAHGRWYPTVIQLPDRTFMASMGEYCDGPIGNCTITQNQAPDLWTTIPGASPADVLTTLSSAPQDVFYPHLFIHPRNGRVFYAPAGRVGQDLRHQSGLYDPLTQTWEPYLPVPPGFPNVRWVYSSSVMMDGTIYRSGGHRTGGTSEDATNACVKIDLASENPSWQTLPPMRFKRCNHCLVALPDGRILAVGGNTRGDRTAATECATPEIFDTEAAQPAWQALSPPDEKIGRGYHLTSLLLPDARVVVAGGEPEFYNLPDWPTQRKGQFYTPQYGSLPNWADFRPEFVGDHPAEIRYGKAFCVDVRTAPGRHLAKMRLVSLGAVTHALNMNQQFVTLEFVPHPSKTGRFIVDAPDSNFAATPGYYMLFAVDSDRVPSIAKIVKLTDFVRAFPQEAALQTGSPLGSPNLLSLVLPDNQRYGSSIASASGESQEVALDVATSVPVASATRIRLRVQHRTTPCASNAVVSLRNWLTQEFDVVGQSECVPADRALEVLVETNADRYVSPIGRMEARLRWTSESLLSPFELGVDRIEFGVEPFANFAPTIDEIGDQITDEHVPWVFPIPASDLDVPLQPLQFSLEGAPEGAVLSPEGVLAWTPGEQDGGRSFQITVRVSDGLAEASRSFRLDVRETNQDPEIQPIADQGVQELTPLEFDAVATDADDPPQSLVFELGPDAPVGASITPHGHFTWVPQETDGPEESVTVLVHDGHGGTDSQVVRIEVREVNEPPTLVPPGDQTVVEGTPLELTIVASDQDDPPNRLTFSLEGAPSGASITPDGHFSWTPTEFQGEGVYPVTVRVVDDGDPQGEDVGSFVVAVTESKSGIPVDLEGTYLAPAPPGRSRVRTFERDGESVTESSAAANAGDATFTPFSDAHKPPSGFVIGMSGKTLSAILEPEGVWGSGTSFILGFEEATPPQRTVLLRIVGGLAGLEALLEGPQGTIGPLPLPASLRFEARLRVESSGEVTAVVRALEGAGVGQETQIGPLPAGLAEVGFVAGFDAEAGLPLAARMRVSESRTDAGANALALFAPQPYVRAGDTIRYQFSQANLERPVGGYQAFLETVGDQSFLEGAYSSGPYTMSVGGPAYDPIGPNLFLARGMALQGRARLDDALLATLDFRAGQPGSLGLRIRPNNGLGLPTIFGDDGTLGEFITPFRRDSNRVVVDDEPPRIEEVSIRQGDHDVLASGTFRRGPLVLSAAVRDEESGLASLPSAVLDLEPLGRDDGEDLAGHWLPEAGNRFRFETILPPPSGCLVRLTWTVQDRSGNVASGATPAWLVDPPRVTLRLRLDHSWVASGVVVRGLEIRIGSGPGERPPLVMDRDVSFGTDGEATIVLDTADGLLCGPYTEVSVKDPLHGLRRRIELQRDGHEYQATVPLASGDVNNDNRVDIADYIVLATRYGQTVEPGTPFPHVSMRHPDLDGSGEIDIGDLAILVSRWFETGDSPPGNYRPR